MINMNNGILQSEAFSKKIRRHWDKENEKWLFSVVDIVGVLTKSKNPQAYWRKLKERLKKEGNETVTNCHGLKMLAVDGKMRKTDVADVEQIFRLIQSIPSPNAEGIKSWLARVGQERLDEMSDPEKAIDRAVEYYQKQGRTKEWINQRVKSIDIRKELTDEWQRGGVVGRQYAILTDVLTEAWSGKTVRNYKEYKGLKKENLRDNMTNLELVLNMLAEASTTEISKSIEPKSFQEHRSVAKKGGNVAKAAKVELEDKTGRDIVSPKKTADLLLDESDE